MNGSMTSYVNLDSTRRLLMPKFAVKMSWLDTYVQVIEAPTEAEAIQEAHDVGDWGDPLPIVVLRPFGLYL